MQILLLLPVSISVSTTPVISRRAHRHPDGQTPRCRMFLWNTANPYRDGAFESGVVIHELSHGLSIRLTGGPANSACLSVGESAGMGEGWGDFLATLIRSKAKYSDYPMGSWVTNKSRGIRRYPYSTVCCLSYAEIPCLV